MDYQKKYLKYKEKYIILKKLVGGSPTVIRRMNHEITLLKENNKINNIIFDEDNLILTCTYNYNINSRINFKFNLGKYYAFRPPEIFVNEIKININSLYIGLWSPILKIINLIDSYVLREYNPNKILIFCHNQIVPSLDSKYHFLAEDIKILCEEENIIDPTIDTVDILSGAVYKDDGFSDEFIEKNLNKYNLVFVPDCGGLWEYLQRTALYNNLAIGYKRHIKIRDLSEEEIEYNLSLLIDHIIKITNLVKEKGIICFSKILYFDKCSVKGIDFNNLLDAIQYFLEQNNFVTEIRKFKNNTAECIVGHKL
jgi:hypothetical protein